MLKRVRWMAVGMAVGIAVTLWVRRRIRRRFDRAVSAVLPGGLPGEAAVAVRDAGARVRAAVHTARRERSRREAELWADLEARPTHARHRGLPGRRPAPVVAGPGAAHQARQ